MDVVVGVAVDAEVNVGLLVRVRVSTGLEIGTIGLPNVAVGTLNVVVRILVSDNEVDVGVAVEAASKATPTIIRFTELAAIRIAAMIRRAVIRTQIFFFHCIDHSYSSILVHSSIGQKLKIPFLV